MSFLANNRIDVFSRISLFLLLIGMGFYIPSEKQQAGQTGGESAIQQYTGGVLGAMLATAFLLLTKMVFSFVPGTFAMSAERTTHSIVYGILIVSLVSILFGGVSSKSSIQLQGVNQKEVRNWAHNCLLLGVVVFICVFAPLLWTNPIAMVFGAMVAIGFIWMDYRVFGSYSVDQEPARLAY